MTQDPNQPAYPSDGNAYPSSGQPVPGGSPAAPPQPVALAVKLMYAGAALSVVSILSSLFLQDSMREQIEAQPGMDQAAVDLATTVLLVVGIVFGIIGVALWILNAVFNAKGKKWARILSTVLGGLAVVGALAGFLQPQPGLSMTLGVVQALLAIGIIVLLWRPESSRFYEAASAPRY